MASDMLPESIASALVDEWERVEGESMRDGHRHTMERLVAQIIRDRVGYDASAAAFSPSSFQAGAEQKWQPIETAPKDGTDLVLWMKSGWAAIGFWFKTDSDAWWVSWATPVQPTYWMPLPVAPEEGR